MHHSLKMGVEWVSVNLLDLHSNLLATHVSVLQLGHLRLRRTEPVSHRQPVWRRRLAPARWGHLWKLTLHAVQTLARGEPVLITKACPSGRSLLQHKDSLAVTYKITGVSSSAENTRLCEGLAKACIYTRVLTAFVFVVTSVCTEGLWVQCFQSACCISKLQIQCGWYHEGKAINCLEV